MGVVLLSLEVEHRVHDVLERFGTGEAAVLRHVPDEECRQVLALGGEQQLCGGLAHLPDAAGSRLKLQREHGLDRIDNEKRGTQPRDLVEDAFETCLREDVERCGRHTKAFAARFDLMLGFLAGAVKHRTGRVREMRGSLKQ